MDSSTTEDRCTKMMRRMYELTKDESLSDLVLLVGGRSFCVHKFVLAAASKKLHKMILSDATMGESGVLTLVLESVTPKSVHLLLKYIYDGQLPEFSNTSNLHEFKIACDVLEVSVPELAGCDDVASNDWAAAADDGKGPEIFIEVLTGLGEDRSTENSDGPPRSSLSKKTNHIKAEHSSTEPSGFGHSADIESTEHLAYRGTLQDVDFAKIGTMELEEIADENGASEFIDVHIMGDEDLSDKSSSDWEYVPEYEIDEGQMGEKKNCGKEKGNAKGEPIIVKGLDISGLFSAKKREYPIKPKRLPPLVPDPSLALRRGRPRLANDHLFPNEPPYICPHMLCGKEWDTREKLKKHYRCHGERTRACGKCNKKFFYKKDLIAHLRTHTGERPFKCHVCDKGFAQKATLQYHMKMHNDARLEYFCEVCSNHYKTFKGLRTHVERAHSDSDKKVFTPDLGVLQNPVSCPVCSRRFRNYQSLNQHMKRQHPNSDETKGLLKGRQNRSKVHATIKGRTQRNIVVLHQPPAPSAEHPDDAMDGSLQFQMDIQNISNDFTISCATCGLNFQRKEAYTKHYASCESISQYLCGYCDRRFSSSKLRLEHVQSVHDVSERTFESEATLTSIEGIVTAENLENVRILNLENMF